MASMNTDWLTSCRDRRIIPALKNTCTRKFCFVHYKVSYSVELPNNKCDVCNIQSGQNVDLIAEAAEHPEVN